MAACCFAICDGMNTCRSTNTLGRMLGGPVLFMSFDPGSISRAMGGLGSGGGCIAVDNAFLCGAVTGGTSENTCRSSVGCMSGVRSNDDCFFGCSGMPLLVGFAGITGAATGTAASIFFDLAVGRCHGGRGGTPAVERVDACRAWARALPGGWKCGRALPVGLKETDGAMKSRAASLFVTSRVSDVVSDRGFCCE